MKNLIAFLFVFASFAANAQSYSGGQDIGQMKPGKMIFGDGKETEVEIQYQLPELFKNPFNKFTIKPSWQDEPYTHSGGIEAFQVDGNIWALRKVPAKTDGYPVNALQFVIMTRQGAIEQYSYVYYGKPDDEPNTLYSDLFKNRLRIINRKVSTDEFIEGALTEEKLREWVADSPESLKDLEDAIAASEQETQNQVATSTTSSVKKKGLMGALEKASNMNDAEIKAKRGIIDLNRIANNYNALYEQVNPGKTKYYFSSPPTWKSLGPSAKTRDEITAEKEAAKAAAFAGRSTTPSPNYASAKDNLPVKKETFAAKMDRIKADGNKVGIVLYLNPVMVPKAAAPSSSMMMSQAMPSNDVEIEGEYMDESLQSLGEDLASELNAALGTSDIELIDLNNIPYRETKFGRLDDWWASKYKVVFAYTVDPRLSASHEEIGGSKKFSASLNVVTSLIATEFVGGPGATKQDLLAQALNMGSFVTPPYTQDEDMSDVQEIYGKILEKLGMPMAEKIRSERADAVVKLVEKKLK